ncbi:MAG: STAS domain-containing protein [Bacteroidetes bacterium]|nr:STAS domain-containing protein [Bacteroidota bacterium]
MEFTFKIEEKKDYCLLHFAGNLIEKNQATELMERFEELLSKDIRKFVIDMSDFKYMNSTGLNTLLTILTRARKAGGEAIISSVPDNIKSLMLITKLNNIFTIVSNESEALHSLLKEA